jgi:60Kd inner membrane protein
MQKVAPPGATNSQQQALFKIMPLMFGVFGISFPSGLVVYWTTSNLWQIGQQYVMLRLGHIGPNAKPPPARTRAGWFSGLMARMEGQRPAEGRERPGDGAKPPPQTLSRGSSESKGRSAKPPSGNGKPGSSGKKPGSGGGSAGSRKKRPKR